MRAVENKHEKMNRTVTLNTHIVCIHYNTSTQISLLVTLFFAAAQVDIAHLGNV